MRVSPALQSAQAAAKASGFQNQAFWDAFLDFFSAEPGQISAATRRQFYDMNRRQPDPHAISLVAKVADHPRAMQAMAAVRAPALLVWGDKDPLLPLAAAKVLQDYLKNAAVSEITMEDVGHYPPIEAPARFAQIIDSKQSFFSKKDCLPSSQVMRGERRADGLINAHHGDHVEQAGSDEGLLGLMG